MDLDRRSLLLGAGAAAAAGPGFALVGGALSARDPFAAAAAARPPRGQVSAQPPDPSTTGLRLGPENNAFVFSGATAGSQFLGAAFGGLGPALFRAVQFPSGYADMPAIGDHWLMLFFRTAAFGSSATRAETLLAVRGVSVTNGSGHGGLYFDSPAHLAGSVDTGQDIAAAAGLVQCQRLNGAFNLWPQAAAGAPTAIALLPDTDYALFLGIAASAGSDNGAMIVVKLSDGSFQQARSPQVLSRNRGAAAPLFDQIGAAGSATSKTDAQGFGGCLGDFAVWNAPFPTPAQAQLIAAGATGIRSVTDLIGSGVLVYWNTLDAGAISAGSLPAQVGPPATVIGLNLLACAPIRQPSAVSLRRLGAHYVFPMACGATDGQAWFEGVAPAGSQVSCCLNYLDGARSAAVTTVADGAGTFRAAIRSTGGRPFHRQASLAGGQAALFVDGDVMDIGIVIPLLGQSETNVLGIWSGGVSAGVNDGPSGNAGHSVTMPGPYGGPWASWIDIINQTASGTKGCRVRGESPRPQIMLGNGMPGDGLAQACGSLINALGVSVMLVMLTRSGTPMDAVLWDGQTFTLSPVLTGRGTAGAPLTGVLGVTTAGLLAKFRLAGLALLPGFINGVAPGSVQIRFPNGGNPINVTDRFSGYSGSGSCVGALTGDAGATGTINYMTGAITLAFAAPPLLAGYTATWAVKQEVQGTNYLSKTANINGWGVRESFDQAAAIGLRHGWSFAWHWWITANQNDVSTLAGALPIIRAKVALLQQRLTGGPNFAGCLAPGLSVDAGCADPPMIVVPRGRATGPANNQTLGKLDIERQVQQALWAPGDTLLGFVRPGAWYFDATIDSPTGSGHADHSDQGARRVGRRMACDWVAAFTVDRPINRGPEWGTPRFDGPVCTVPLAYIGVGLTLTTAGNPAALNEWYVGDATRLGSIIDNGVFATAAIRADGLAVTLTRASGSWLGSEVIRYLVGAPGASTGQVVAPPSLVYDGRGGFGGFEPGLPAAPRFA